MEDRRKIEEFFANYIKNLDENSFVKTPGGMKAIESAKECVIEFYDSHRDSYEEVKDNGGDLRIDAKGGDQLHITLTNYLSKFFLAKIVVYDNMATSRNYIYSKRDIRESLRDDNNISYRDQEYKSEVFDALDEGEMGRVIMAKDPSAKATQQVLGVDGSVISSQTATLEYASDTNYVMHWDSNLNKAAREADNVLGQFRGMEQEDFEGKLTIKNDLDTGDKIM